MPRAEIATHLQRIDFLALEIERHVPISASRVTEFRADLAGLLTVSIVATYETCVKDVLVNYATYHHVNFGEFTQRNYDRLNSRISISDLHKYASLFDGNVSVNFRSSLNNKRNKIENRIGINIEQKYTQLLRWRHDFAHAGRRVTTIEEAIQTHMFAKRVITAFTEAFQPDSP